MIADSSVSPQYIMNIHTGEIGVLRGYGPSPYTFEAMDGIDRVHVTTFIPSASGAMFEASDYWLLDDCVFVTDAVSTGATVTVLGKRGLPYTATVLSAKRTEVCVMLANGAVGWLYWSRVVAVSSPLIETALAVA